MFEEETTELSRRFVDALDAMALGGLEDCLKEDASRVAPLQHDGPVHVIAERG